MLAYTAFSKKQKRLSLIIRSIYDPLFDGVPIRVHPTEEVCAYPMLLGP